MPKAIVKAHICRNIDATAYSEERSKMTYEQMQDFKPYSSNYFAFTTVMFNPNDGLVYCGTTAYDSEIMWTFDPATKKFENLHWPETEGADRYDIKVHRSLVLDDDGMIYGATACLHPLQSRLKAKGGKVFRLDPKTKKFEILGIPVKYDYIQCIAMDHKRKIIYGFTWPVPKFFRLDVLSRESIDFDYVGGQPHIPAVDDEGTLWGAVGWSGDQIFSYHPDRGATWHKQTIGQLVPGANGIDGMITGDDGFIYIGTIGGSLLRLDPRDATLKYLGHPCPGNRLAGLAIGKDGLIYGSGGSDFKTYVFAYDREAERFYDLGPLYDPEINESAFIAHHATVSDDGTIYSGDTDSPKRSGFLWEIKVKW